MFQEPCSNGFLADPAPTKFVPDAPTDQIGAANKAAAATEHGPAQDVIDMLKAVPAALLPALKGIIGGTLNTGGGTHILENAQNLYHQVTHPGEVLSSVGTTLQNATPAQVGANVVAPLIAGGAVGKVAGLTAAPLSATEDLGLRTGGTGGLERGGRRGRRRRPRGSEP